MMICQHLRRMSNPLLQQSWLAPIVHTLPVDPQVCHSIPLTSVKEMLLKAMNSLKSLANAHARNVAVSIVLELLSENIAKSLARIVEKSIVMGATASIPKRLVKLVGIFTTRNSNDEACVIYKIPQRIVVLCTILVPPPPCLFLSLSAFLLFFLSFPFSFSFLFN